MELKLRRNGKWQKRLVQLPESGMGYQIVDITLKDARIMVKVCSVVVCGAVIVYLPASYENVCEKDIIKIEMSK